MSPPQLGESVCLEPQAMRPTISPRRRSQSLEVQKRPAFFSQPRQPPFVISRDPARRRCIERPPISRPMQIAPRFDTPHLRGMPTPEAAISVSPHTSGWIQVADDVVGRHPYGKPLITRIATQAEIALISGHVHIPWAFEHLKKTQPVPVKIQKPSAAMMPSLVLGNVGNTHGRYVINDNTKFVKGKHFRHGRGKENIPIAPLPARSSRR